MTETQQVSVLGHQGHKIFYNKEVDNNEYAVMQSMTINQRMLYVITYNVPTQLFDSNLSDVARIIDSIVLIE